MDVFKLWFDHGKSPDSASYQYIVVPDVGQQELVQTSWDNRRIEIIDVSLMMLGMMDIHRLGIDIGFECVLRVRKLG